MIRNMLEHQKKVIENVTKNDKIFRKEIRKSHEWLTDKDFNKLKEWLKFKFNVKLN